MRAILLVTSVLLLTRPAWPQNELLSDAGLESPVSTAAPVESTSPESTAVVPEASAPTRPNGVATGLGPTASADSAEAATAESSSAPSAADSAEAATAEPSSAPSATVLPEADSEAAPEFGVSLAERTVFTLRTSDGGKSPEQRARQASKALAAAVHDKESADVKLVREAETAVVYVGRSPVVRLTAADAALEGSSLDVYADTVAVAVRRAIEAERRRGQIAKNVFSASLVVFFALVAFYLVRKVGELSARGRSWVENHGDDLRIRVRHFELVRREMLQSAALVGVGVAKWFAQIGILYAWLVVVLSLFESTRGYTEKLTGFVVRPLSELATRIAVTSPLLVVAAIAGLALFVLLRFVGLLFASVARQETTFSWVPPDLALPTSVLLRAAIVVSALIFAAPVVTGDADGAIPRIGIVVVGAVALGSVPLLASMVVGSAIVFGRRLRPGDYAQVGTFRGRVQALNLLELKLQTDDETVVRIPHLLLLKCPLQHLKRAPDLEVSLSIGAGARPAQAEQVLADAARSFAKDARVELVSAGPLGLVYRVAVPQGSAAGRSALLSRLVEAATEARLPFGSEQP